MIHMHNKMKDPLQVSLIILFIFLESFVLLQTVTCQTRTVLDCPEESTTNSSSFLKNIDILLSKLISESNQNYFFNYTVVGTDALYGLYMCLGEISNQLCHTCVQDASHYMKQNCPNGTQATFVYFGCTLRYANHNIFSVSDASVWFPSGEATVNGRGTGETYAKDFGGKLGNMIRGLMDEAAYVSPRHFAINKSVISSYATLYGIVQCTPDISDDDCKDCLVQGYKYFAVCCNDSYWGQMFLPSCKILYSIDPLFPDSALPPTKSVNVPTPSNVVNIFKRSKSPLAAIICSVVVGEFVLLVCIWLCLKKWQTKNKRQRGDNIGGEQVLQYDFSTLKAATSNFSTDNKIGQGGFGIVYKGKFEDGQEVAIKRLLKNSSRHAINEFKSEAHVVGRLQHRNLVKLLGFCIEGEELLLVYEFLPNTSLDRFLFDPVRRGGLNWGTRRDIIVGIARGLLYLHEDSRQTIIHRDLKSSNILLDQDMRPKIADFGIAKLVETKQTHGDTSKVVGTWGYMAPEYVTYGQFSVKSDVFSFGVIVLEIISGLKSLSPDSQKYESLYLYAWKLWNERTILDLIDPTTLCGTDNESEVLRFIHIALLCVQNKATGRPTMASVIRLLTSTTEALPSPSPLSPIMKPPFENNNVNVGNNSESQQNSNVLSEDFTVLYPR